jgi:hypothetical protein
VTQRGPKEDPRYTWEQEMEKILKERGTEWNGIRAIAGERERWKALFFYTLYIY